MLIIPSLLHPSNSRQPCHFVAICIVKPFLVVDTEALSVGPSVHASVGPSVCEHNPKSKRKQRFFYVCVSVGVGVCCKWWLYAPAHSSATILWPHVTGFFSLFKLWLSIVSSCLLLSGPNKRISVIMNITPSDWSYSFLNHYLSFIMPCQL